MRFLSCVLMALFTTSAWGNGETGVLHRSNLPADKDQALKALVLCKIEATQVERRVKDGEVIEFYDENNDPVAIYPDMAHWQKDELLCSYTQRCLYNKRRLRSAPHQLP